MGAATLFNPLACTLVGLLIACSHQSDQEPSGGTTITGSSSASDAEHGGASAIGGSTTRVSGGTGGRAWGGAATGGHLGSNASGASWNATAAGSASELGTAGYAGNRRETSAAGRAGAIGSASAAGQGGNLVTSLSNPHLPMPSHDCRVDTSENCISIAGVYDGAPIDVFCNAPAAVQTVVHAGKWVIGCDDFNGGFARLYVPIQAPGSLAETASAGTSLRTEFQFCAGGASTLALFSGNFVSAELSGNVAVTSAPYRTVSGTFHSLWAAPTASCSSLSGASCAAAELNVTFRLSTRYGSCLSNDDCKAPLTCSMVGYACLNM